MKKRLFFFLCAVYLYSAQMWGQTYYAGDVAVINRMIANNGLQTTANSPSNWSSFATWTVINNYLRITSLGNFHGNLTGDLDLQELTELQWLGLELGNLTKLNVSGLTKLGSLNCSRNQLTSLNVNGCVALKSLDCTLNQLTSLDVSSCTALASLIVSQCKLTSLNVSGCQKLTEINCTYNQFTSLNVLGLASLYSFDCRYNQLTSLNMKGCAKLGILSCDNNPLTSLDLSGCVALSTMSSYSTLLAKLIIGDGSTLNVNASPTAGGVVSILRARGNSITIWATANKDYAFYDWTVMVEDEKPSNYAFPSEVTFNLSGSVHTTFTANFAGGPPVVSVASITLDKTSLSLQTGETSTLKATITPANATNQTVTWQSNNTAVATITTAGGVTGVAAGTATITATADGKTATCSVTVTAAAAKSDFEVVNGVLVKYNGAGGNVVIPNNLGITAIGDKAFFGCTGLTAVDIPQSIKSIGQWAFFQCTSLRDVTVHWDKAADIPDVNAFYNADIVSAMLHVPASMKPYYQAAYGWDKFGFYQDAYSGNENSGSSLTLNHWCWWLKIGETLTLTASQTPEAATNYPLIWISDNPEIATVTGTGLTATIKAVAEGFTYIWVFSESGAWKSCAINVSPSSSTSSNYYWASVTQYPVNGMVVGEKYQCLTRIGPENLSDLSYSTQWTSSNPSVATVASNGLITAIAKGTTNIQVIFTKNGWTNIDITLQITVIDNSNYNTSDIDALKNFVSQGDNYRILGLDANWQNDANWHEKVKGITWNYRGDNPEMRITEIDWSFYNIAGRLDATPFISLKTLKVSYTNLTEINVAGLQSLNNLSCSYIGLLRYLDVSNTPNLGYLFCAGNILDFNTLPPNDNYWIYSYAPQLTINRQASPGEDVDLTDYLHNNKTVFKWYRQTNLSAQLTDIMEKSAKGTFFIPAQYADTDLLCIMTNSDFPDFAGDNAMKCRVHVGSSDVAVDAEQNKVVGAGNNNGSIDINVGVPSGATAVFAEMRINFPHGIRLDEESLEKYTAQSDYVMKKVEETTSAVSNSWLLSFFFDWIPSFSSPSFRASGQPLTLLNIPFIFDEQLADGNYPVTISDINLNFDDGTIYAESELSVSVTIDRTQTGINKIRGNVVSVYVRSNKLYINSPAAETIQIYAITGKLLYRTAKPAGEIQIPITDIKDKIVIVKGDSGWVKKVIMN